MGTPAHAALGKTTLSDLVNSSEVILKGRVVQCTLVDAYGGSAAVEIEKFYKSSVAQSRINVPWLIHPERQRLDRVGDNVLLFLSRSKEGHYEEARVGRSFWPLITVFHGERVVTPYIDPLTLVILDVPDIIVKAAVPVLDLPWKSNPVEMDVVPLDLLIPAIRKILGNEQK